MESGPLPTDGAGELVLQGNIQVVGQPVLLTVLEYWGQEGAQPPAFRQERDQG